MPKKINPDKLETMLDMQETFMHLVKVKFANIQEQHQLIKNTMLAIMCECGEVLDEKQGGIQWKPWRQFKSYECEESKVHKAYVKEELIDIFHFLLEAMLLWNMDADDIYESFRKKMQKNIDRQKGGY